MSVPEATKRASGGTSAQSVMVYLWRFNWSEALISRRNKSIDLCVKMLLVCVETLKCPTIHLDIHLVWFHANILEVTEMYSTVHFHYLHFKKKFRTKEFKGSWNPKTVFEMLVFFLFVFFSFVYTQFWKPGSFFQNIITIIQTPHSICIIPRLFAKWHTSVKTYTHLWKCY